LTHLGPSGMSGHFIAFCKSPVDKQWYCYNDATVSRCNDPRDQNNNELEGIPYVLFYQKNNSEIFGKSNINNNNDYDNNDINYSNGFKNEGKQDNNSITLNFSYNGMELPLSVFPKYNRISPSSLVNELISKYNHLPQNIFLLFQNGVEMLDLREYLRYNKLKDGDKILIIVNDQ